MSGVVRESIYTDQHRLPQIAYLNSTDPIMFGKVNRHKLLLSKTFCRLLEVGDTGLEPVTPSLSTFDTFP